jgi:NAD(P)-dependent dehydrogenase (short-subunit alcohol dehydrogenase family)
MFRVNTLGAFIVLQKVLPLMKEQRFGRVAAIPGILGKAPMMQGAAYCAAKYGLTGMIKCLKDEYKRFGIRFSLMHFGGVDTSFWDNIDMRISREKLLTVGAASKALYHAITQEGEGVMAEVVLMPESHQLV